MRALLSLLVFAVLGCAPTLGPTEKIASEYTMAFLRRDVESMRGLSIPDAPHPTPNFSFSTLRVVRACPPVALENGEGQLVIVLFGRTEATSFNAVAVNLRLQDSQWIVYSADLVRNSNGAFTPYSRTCKNTYIPGTTGEI
jgi:hypothetical protein